MKPKSNNSVQSNKANKKEETSTQEQKVQPLYEATCRGDKIAVQHILSKNGASQEESSRSLRTASWNGHADVVHLLLQYGVDANTTDSPGNSALHRAVRNGHGKIARLLIEHGADPFLGSPSPMKLAEILWNGRPLTLFQELVREYHPKKLREHLSSADQGFVYEGTGYNSATSRHPWPDRTFIYRGAQMRIPPSDPAYWY